MNQREAKRSLSGDVPDLYPVNNTCKDSGGKYRTRYLCHGKQRMLCERDEHDSVGDKEKRHRRGVWSWTARDWCRLWGTGPS